MCNDTSHKQLPLWCLWSSIMGWVIVVLIALLVGLSTQSNEFSSIVSFGVFFTLVPFICVVQILSLMLSVYGINRSIKQEEPKKNSHKKYIIKYIIAIFLSLLFLVPTLLLWFKINFVDVLE